jgi:glycosyltransferase involved in cell wall biosynthesis
MNRSRRPRIAVCTAQVPFVRGGAELHIERLAGALRGRGCEVEIVAIPFKEYPRTSILEHALAWRLIDLEESAHVPIDAVVATKFPSYLVRHPVKVVWLIHQFRQVYDQYATEYSDFTSTPEDRRYRELVAEMDRNALSEARKIYTNSKNVADRLRRFNGIEGEPLYHPPPLFPGYRSGEAGDYFLSVGRLDVWKRVDLGIRALGSVPGMRLLIAGTGEDRPRLEEVAREAGVADRAVFLGAVDDETLLGLYSEARGVLFAPRDEDYGYITLEAFLSERPVVTTNDAGGPLEFVRDGESGFVVDPAPESVAEAMQTLAADPVRARTMGRAGKAALPDLSWDHVVESLLSAAGITV